MEVAINWLLMAVLCILAAVNLDVYIKEKALNPVKDFVWLNLAAALFAIISALKIALR